MSLGLLELPINHQQPIQPYGRLIIYFLTGVPKIPGQHVIPKLRPDWMLLAIDAAQRILNPFQLPIGTFGSGSTPKFGNNLLTFD